jgi:hypothetical protein
MELRASREMLAFPDPTEPRVMLESPEPTVFLPSPDCLERMERLEMSVPRVSRDRRERISLRV